jgi:hypothetical protein
MPQPLDPSDAVRIRRIFAWQEHGDIRSDPRHREIRRSLLAGHILADRYLRRFHRAKPDQAAGWLERYADLPDAPAIRPAAASPPKGPWLPPAPPRHAGAGWMRSCCRGRSSVDMGNERRDRRLRHLLFAAATHEDALRARWRGPAQARPGLPVSAAAPNRQAGLVGGLAAWRPAASTWRKPTETAALAAGPASIRAAAAFLGGAGASAATGMRRVMSAGAACSGAAAHLLWPDCRPHAGPVAGHDAGRRTGHRSRCRRDRRDAAGLARPRLLWVGQRNGRRPNCGFSGPR